MNKLNFYFAVVFSLAITADFIVVKAGFPTSPNEHFRSLNFGESAQAGRGGLSNAARNREVSGETVEPGSRRAARWTELEQAYLYHMGYDTRRSLDSGELTPDAGGLSSEQQAPLHRPARAEGGAPHSV